MRQLKQPRKDTLREWLRNAAERIEQLQARVLWWEEHHEHAVAAALADDGMPRGLVLVVGFLLGALVVAIVEALT